MVLEFERCIGLDLGAVPADPADSYGEGVLVVCVGSVGLQ